MGTAAGCGESDCCWVSSVESKQELFSNSRPLSRLTCGCVERLLVAALRVRVSRAVLPCVHRARRVAHVPQEVVPPERLAAREWYRDAKFGLFIHWGVYSLLGNGEWVMQNRGIRVPEYEWLATTFNPARFDAEEWVSIAKAAGMRYITITSRHHDGFSMFGSRVTKYNIVDWTPFRRDPLKELAEACRRHGLKLFFYYSQLDWRHPDYWPRGGTGLNDRPARLGRVGPVPRLHGRPARGVADRLRPVRRDLVRRHVGQAHRRRGGWTGRTR